MMFYMEWADAHVLAFYVMFFSAFVLAACAACAWAERPRRRRRFRR